MCKNYLKLEHKWIPFLSGILILFSNMVYAQGTITYLEYIGFTNLTDSSNTYTEGDLTFTGINVPLLKTDKDGDGDNVALKLHGGDEGIVEITRADKNFEILTFLANRWTSAAPFSFRVDAFTTTWQEIYSGDMLATATSPNQYVAIDFIAHNTNRIRIRVTSPPGSGGIVDAFLHRETMPGEMARFTDSAPNIIERDTVLFHSGYFVRDPELQFFPDAYGVTQYRIPQISVTKDGTLLVAVNGRIDRDGDLGWSTTFFAVSHDNGATWEYVRYSTDYQNPDRIGEDKSGPYPLTHGTQDGTIAYNPATLKYVSAFISKYQQDGWVVFSDDLETWTQPQKLPRHEDFQTTGEHVPGPASIMIDTDDSTYLFTTHNGELCAIYLTKDFVNYKMSPAVTGTESMAVPLKDGKYFLVARNSSTKTYIYDSNTDHIQEMELNAQSHGPVEHSILGEYDSLYFVTPTSSRTGGVVYKSLDEGNSWVNLGSLNDIGEYFAYSSIVRMANGKLAVVYEGDFNPPDVLTKIHFAVLNVDEKNIGTSINGYDGVEQSRIKFNSLETALYLNNDFQEDYQVLVHDLTGKMVVNKIMGKHNRKIEMSGIRPGVYFLSIHSKNHNLVQKFVYK